MDESLIWLIPSLFGLWFVGRGVWHVASDALALRRKAETDPRLWELVKGDAILIGLIGVTLMLTLSVAALAWIYESPRPKSVGALMGLLLLPLPVILGLMALHMDVVRKRGQRQL